MGAIFPLKYVTSFPSISSLAFDECITCLKILDANQVSANSVPFFGGL